MNAATKMSKVSVCMRYLAGGLVAVGLTLALGQSAQAGGGKGGKGGKPATSAQAGGGKGGKLATKNFNNFRNGKNFKGGHHWSKSCWSDRYGCTLCYDPDADGWYWWSQEDGCWYRLPDDQ